MSDGVRARLPGFAVFALFLWCLPIANWLGSHVGTHCAPDGDCVLRIGPGLQAGTGVAMTGVALVLRGLVQHFLGLAPSFIAVLGGALVTAVVAPPDLMVASTMAVLAGELSGLAVFTAAQRHGVVVAMAASALVGVAVDSVVVLEMTAGSLEQLPAAALLKLLAAAACMPFVVLVGRVAPDPAG